MMVKATFLKNHHCEVQTQLFWFWWQQPNHDICVHSSFGGTLYRKYGTYKVFLIMAVINTNYKLWHDTNSEFYHDFMHYFNRVSGFNDEYFARKNIPLIMVS